MSFLSRSISRLLPVLLLLALALTSCVDDKPKPSDPGNNLSEGRKVFIANEGSLGNGNASLSYYNIDKDSVFNQVYSNANQQAALGDVFQSILQDGDRLYLAVNNSDRITVVGKKDYTLIGQITVSKPRYMLRLGEHKMYVTSLYSHKVNIVDPATLQQTGTIDIDYPNSEGLAALNGKVYVCNWDTACNYIYEIDPVGDSITARIPIAGRAAQQVLTDKNGKLWVLAGNVYKGKVATLTQIDPATKSILKSFTFPAGADVMKPCWNPTADTLYFLGVNYNGGTDYNGVYRMSVYDNTPPSTLLIPAQQLQYYWGLGVDPVKNQLYLSDPKGFIQNGSVGIYQPDGQKIKSFDVGIGPGFFSFETE